MNQNKQIEKTPILKKLERFLEHNVIPYQKWYFLFLVIIVLVIPLSRNINAGNPILIGGESYFHLNQAKEVGWSNFHYLPLSLIQQFLEPAIDYLPLILAITFVMIFQSVSRQNGFHYREIFMFLLLLIISPVFIYSFSSLSSGVYFTLLVLMGFLFLNGRNKFLRILALFPFVLATFFDLLSTILLLLIQTIYFQKYLIQKERKYSSLLFISATGFLLFVHGLVLKQPLVLGPFHLQQPIADLISDLGGLSGLGFFVLLLSLIGISITWKNKQSRGPYLLLPILIAGYIFSTQVIFLLSLVIIYFASAGFLKLLERKWDLEHLKAFTVLLLILGITFSTLTYLDRINQIGPLAGEVETLTLLRNSVPPRTLIFSAPESGDYIAYFSRGTPYSTLRDSGQKINVTKEIFTAAYLDQLSPLLSKEEIYFIYLSEKTLAKLPANQGLLFLIESERFKLIHSHKNNKVWMFKKEDGNIP